MTITYPLHKTLYFPNSETSLLADAVSPLTCKFIAVIDINLSYYGCIVIHEIQNVTEFSIDVSNTTFLMNKNSNILKNNIHIEFE